MGGFVVHEVAADVEVRVGRASHACAVTGGEMAVELLWQAACRRIGVDGVGQLFDGRVFSADSIARASSSDI
jgi:hypothetical protein